MADTTQPPLAQAFTAWLQAGRGHVNPKLDFFAETGDSGRGVVAKEAVAEGELLILVPLPLVLRPLSREDEPTQGAPVSDAAQYLHSLSASISPFIATVLLLLHEQAKGEDSPFYPYLQTLPPTTNCTLLWTPEERLALKGTAIESEGGSDPQDLFTQSILPAMEARPELWPQAVRSYAAFAKGVALVQSRAFHLAKENWVTSNVQHGTDLYLLPGIDMINHSSNPELRNTALELVREARDGNESGEETLEPHFIMRAGKPIAAGGQVLHSYGDLSDAQLLLTYGFVDWQPGFVNPHNLALVPAGSVVATCEKMADEGSIEQKDDKLQWLRGSGTLPMDFFGLTPLDPLPDDLVTTAQVLLMYAEDFQEVRCEMSEQAPPGSSSPANGDAAPAAAANQGAPALLGKSYLDMSDYSRLVLVTLMAIVREAKQRYPASLEADEAALREVEKKIEGMSGGDEGSAEASHGEEGQVLKQMRLRDALRVRVGEQAILAEACKGLVGLMADLEGKEEDDDGSDGEGSESLGSQDTSDGDGSREGNSDDPSGEHDGGEDGDGEGGEGNSGDSEEGGSESEGEEPPTKRARGE